MIYIVQNLLPILVASLLGLIAGLVVQRLRPAKLTPGQLVVAAVAQTWLCCILAGALILAPPEAGRWTMSLGSAVVIWIGFVVPTTVVGYAARGVPGRATAVDCAQWLVTMLVQATTLTLIGLTPPTS
ncbi:DUF1761 domain-containing protein [Brevundimonas variabilis]|uniref:Uncharacterized protein n=1 Tax=Brevundimonas variabilis TaxID=74312 RepID=A0A7W9CHU4_9CAUL|nr:DUF1761 domain-containing protein [Brevundimonas variabilis]MBB5745929.1 hypothetical protein [Brevundimonas variabilis]